MSRSRLRLGMAGPLALLLPGAGLVPLGGGAANPAGRV